jgi:hypothetical protein
MPKLPKLMETAVKKLKGKVDNPYAVASATLQKSGSLKPGTNTATAKGQRRGAHSEAWRDSHPSRAKRAIGGTTPQQAALNPGMGQQYTDMMDQGQSHGLAAQMATDARKRGGAVEGKAKKPHLGRAR